MATAQKTNQFDPRMRGYHAVYREQQTNYCPGCGRTHWIIGRTSAECAFCACALPLDFSLAAPTEGAVIAVNDNHHKVKTSPFSMNSHQRESEVVTANFRPVYDNTARGYHAVYRENQVNNCPGCGRTHWILGRMTAECAFCSTSLPLDTSLASPADTALIVSHDNHRVTKGEVSRTEGMFEVQ